jgi:hypothetical protein
MAHTWHGPPIVQVPLISERHSKRLVFAVFVMAAGEISIALAVLHGDGQRGREDGQRPPIPAKEQPSIGRYVVGPHQGRPVSLAEGRAIGKLEDAAARASYSLLEVVFEPHSAVPMIHVHADFTESYLVVDGDVRGHVGAGPRGSSASRLPRINPAPNSFRDAVAQVAVKSPRARLPEISRGPAAGRPGHGAGRPGRAPAWPACWPARR